ncbi:30S ribosomal protein S31, chloroplastic [Rhodamnia argentea]|uniref:30S ribosomal protein S31, chloroplastic n=1 Tax=Rhodamnia argentea TaxID=178133 RepID=A0A8B8QXG5_9MYRT|nr:30S ribosomal protein S31, chloroplastic [Rhodamnia argentea]
MAFLLLRPPSVASPSPLAFSRSQTLGASLSTTPASLSLPAATSAPSVPLVYCGRGDKKTAKGKRFNHSFGNARPRNKKKGRGPPRVAAPPAPPRKDRFEDNEVIKIDIDESLFTR